jgi:hypothetical protein
MNTINSAKLRQGLIFVLTLAVLALMTMFCSCKKSAEKTSEKMMETAIGDNANVNIDDQKVVIETEEGTFTSDASVKTWPKEIPNYIPEFKDGKIANLSTQLTNEGKAWTFIFENVSSTALKDYKKLLTDKGFKVSSISAPGGQGQITGEKDKTIVAMMSGDNMATLNVSIEN